MAEEQDAKQLENQRQESLHDRESTQEERKKIQKRRREIEQRRQILSHSNNDPAGRELLDLQLEVVKLQEYIVELQLVSDHQRAFFAELKDRANGLWQDLSMPDEESQIKRESIQKYAEAIQKMHEQLQKQEEDWDEKSRSR